MRILVCVKQVPDTTEVKLSSEYTLQRDFVAQVMNPADESALEKALALRDQHGGTVTVMTMGPARAESMLREAITRGADEAIHLTDSAFAGADTLATSYALSLWCRTAGLDLILCGKMAVDGDTAQSGPELAEHLGIPHITDVCEIMEIDEQKVKVRKQTARGFEILRTPLPALLTVVKDINLPRMASIPGVKAGMEADIRIYTAADLGADPDRCGLSGSPTQVVRTFTPQRSAEAVEITGATGDKAAKILEMLREVQ